MVGEIRDPETAQIAVQAALTGHLVFTTVHANNVFDVIGRFMHMEVDPYSFVVRTERHRCPAAGALQLPALQHGSPDRGWRSDGIRIEPRPRGEFRFRRGKGCGQCRGTGYRGRKAIAEVRQCSTTKYANSSARATLPGNSEAARATARTVLREGGPRSGQATEKRHSMKSIASRLWHKQTSHRHPSRSGLHRPGGERTPGRSYRRPRGRRTAGTMAVGWAAGGAAQGDCRLRRPRRDGAGEPVEPFRPLRAGALA